MEGEVGGKAKGDKGRAASGHQGGEERTGSNSGWTCGACVTWGHTCRRRDRRVVERTAGPHNIQVLSLSTIFNGRVKPCRVENRIDATPEAIAAALSIIVPI